MKQKLSTGIKKYFVFNSLMLLAFSLFSPLVLDAQVEYPKWDISVSKTEVNQCEVVELVLKCKVPDTWYIYSNDMDPNLGPNVPYFEYEKSGIELIGEPFPKKAKKVYDEVWEGEVSKMIGTAEIHQKVKLTSLNPSFKVLMEYQMCSEVTGQCVMGSTEAEFKDFKVTKSASGCGDTQVLPKTGNADKPSTTPVVPANSEGDAVESTVEENQKIDSSENTKVKTTSEIREVTDKTFLDEEGCETRVYVDDAGVVHDDDEKRGLVLFALFAFIGGLAGLLTPCVFPMIPMTVTFFLKNAKSKRAAIFQGLIYGFSIIAIYTIIGTLFTVFFGAAGANEFSTNAWVNLTFFAVFVIFAISFFGAFEITLPSRFVNSMDKQSDRGGLIGVFFMAFTLVLVSFSCTGPIVGTILVEASQGAVIRPVVGMIGFSLAFALPFTLFAMFPQWLNSLPKSGGWLNSVKVVLGFIELALGLKFLSVADQVYHWGLLDREIYIGLWIVIAILCGLYLIGKLKFTHDSDLKFVSVPRLFFAISAFAFVFYLIPGLFGASLPGLAGYLPPTTSHGFNLPLMIQGDEKGNLCEDPKYDDKLHLPHGLKGYFEYKQAIRCARQQKKPLFIDFTGHGCVNCRKMEDKVWANPEILEMLKEDFVVVALYVDDRSLADSSDWFVSNHDGKLKKTIGKINADIQICKFNHIAQPYYVLLDNDEQLLAKPTGTEYDVAKFRKFLEDAKKQFKNREKEES